MASAVDICNMALMRCGSSATIASLTEGSTEANICAVWYPSCRDYVLRHFPWRFAHRREALAELAKTAGETTNGLPGGRTYKYSVPTDCLDIHGLQVVGTQPVPILPMIPFELLNDGTAKAIYTDLEDAEISYTSQVTDTTLWDPMAVNALSCLLGAEIASALTVNSNIAMALRDAYELMVLKAAAKDANEGYSEPITDGFSECYS